MSIHAYICVECVCVMCVFTVLVYLSDENNHYVEKQVKGLFDFSLV